MEGSADEYAAFQERVKRTVYIYNMSPQVTESILKSAFEQFWEVVNIEFITNCIYPQTLPKAALVELRTESDVRSIVTGISETPFMICGMPRPVRACAAEEEMFEDRPRKPGRKITFQWLDAGDPKFEVAREMKNLIRKQADEAEYLLKCQLEEEEKLAKQQDEILQANYRKYEMIGDVLFDGTAPALAQCYNMRLPNP